jgi:hypothetical protein
MMSERPEAPPRARPQDAAFHAQTIGALLIGILLVAGPLYLWRRPRTVPVVHADAGSDAAPSRDGATAKEAPPDAAVLHVKIAEPRVLECHDRGSRKTPADQCDHVTAFEKAFADAIEAAHDCVPPSAGTGSLEFVADVSFVRKRHPVLVTLPRDGRSIQNPKIVKECAAAVRSRISSFALLPLQHAHARYKVSFIASYGG